MGFTWITVFAEFIYYDDSTTTISFKLVFDCDGQFERRI